MGCPTQAQRCSQRHPWWAAPHKRNAAHIDFPGGLPHTGDTLLTYFPGGIHQSATHTALCLGEGLLRCHALLASLRAFALLGASWVLPKCQTISAIPTQSLRSRKHCSPGFLMPHAGEILLCKILAGCPNQTAHIPHAGTLTLLPSC